MPVPIIRLLMIARRQASAVKSSSNQRSDQEGIGYVRMTLEVKASGRMAMRGATRKRIVSAAKAILVSFIAMA
ncbi:hypothetical protein D3C87_2154930 [compost metagenome]